MDSVLKSPNTFVAPTAQMSSPTLAAEAVHVESPEAQLPHSMTGSPKASSTETKIEGPNLEWRRRIFKAQLDQPTCLLPKGKSWKVPVDSMTSKWFRWNHEDYESGLNFGFSAQFSSFFLFNGQTVVHQLEGSYGWPLFFAIATIGDRPRIRLIPFNGDFNLQSEVYDIDFENAEFGEAMVRKLVKMGCTVVRRPEGNLAFSVGVDTKLREMAAAITDTQTNQWSPDG
ncbi:MAG: hypothetical protein Q9221_008821 [Calogaya cf. arnoldii]